MTLDAEGDGDCLWTMPKEPNTKQNESEKMWVHFKSHYTKCPLEFLFYHAVKIIRTLDCNALILAPTSIFNENQWEMVDFLGTVISSGQSQILKIHWLLLLNRCMQRIIIEMITNRNYALNALYTTCFRIFFQLSSLWMQNIGWFWKPMTFYSRSM